MKITTGIQGSLENKISFFHLALFLVLLPFDRFYSQLVLASFVLHIFIHSNRARWQRVISWQNLLLASVFFVTLTGMAWSTDRREGIKVAEHQLAILLFPLLFSLGALPADLYKKKLLVLFGLTCTATVAFLYIDALRIILYYKLSISSVFSGAFIHHNFSSPVGIHATYLSLYISLSLISFLSFLKKEKDRTLRVVYTAAIVVLSAGLVQLGSKSVIIATGFFTIIVLPFFMQERAERTKYISIASLIALASLLIITKVGSFKKRYVTEMKGDLTEATTSNIILEPRLIRWKSALALIKKAPIAGYGSGSENRMLKEKYFEDKLYDSYLHELNTHNQYLSFLLTTGIPGLAVFLTALGRGFLLAWRRKDVILGGFMFLLSIVSFSENILAVNKGIFFYAFFFSLLVKRGPVSDKPLAT